MPTTGADCTQQCVFAQALGGGDGKHVVNDETADAKGNERKCSEKCGEKAECLADLVLFFLGNFRTGQCFKLGRGWQRASNLRREFGIGKRSVTLDKKGIHIAGSKQKLGCSGLIEQRKRGPTKRTHVTKSGDAHKSKLATT